MIYHDSNPDPHGEVGVTVQEESGHMLRAGSLVERNSARLLRSDDRRYRFQLHGKAKPMGYEDSVC
jgi:hypothetical protein